jgi:hypothetical protein
MYLPSGDQSGSQFAPAPCVTSMGSPPLICWTQILVFPPRSELYARNRPSGDQVGSL